jgi:uncharacterized membrane protein
MAHGDKHDDECSCCYCHGAKAVVGIVIGVIAFILVLAVVLWLIRLVFGIALGVATLSIFAPHFILGAIFFIIILCIIFWLIRLPFRIIRGGSRRDIRILRRRYASGEISEAQFKRMMKNLREQGRY